MVLTRYIVDFFSFVDCIKKWNWEKEGMWAIRTVQQKFKQDRKKGLWKNFKNVRDFNTRVCKCLCDNANDYDLEYIVGYEFCYDQVCQCKCQYKGVFLNENDSKKIIKYMKDIGEVDVNYNDFTWKKESFYHVLPLITDIGDIGREPSVTVDNWFKKYIIKLFNLSKADLDKMKKEYENAHLHMYARSYNMLNMMSGMACLSYSS